MVPKHLRKSNGGLGGDQESLMASLIELQERVKNDKSVLRQPIDTGVRGVKDLIKAVVGGTQELQELLLNECTIIYECKICRNLFRSLANFISHKRIYCIKNFTYFTDASAKQEKDIFNEDHRVTSEIVKYKDEVNLKETKVWLASDSIVPNNIKTEKNNCLKPSRRIRFSPVKITRKCDIAKIADGLSQKAQKESFKSSDDSLGSIYYSDTDERVTIKRSHPKLSSYIETSTSSVLSKFFQNNLESSNSECLDSVQLEAIERLSPYNEAVLQENGKFKVTPQGMRLEENKNLDNYKCSLCETHFITKQTLSRHIQIHHKERICYPCPVCRTFFPSPSSTYRHLSKDHHKTEQQIRRLRPKVLTKAIKRKLLDGASKKEASDGIMQRLNEYPENGLCCSNCGKMFNRHAVLRVHITSCKGKESPNEKLSAAKAPNQLCIKPPALPSVNKLANESVQQKSGILVRKDYCKKLNRASTLKNPMVENNSCKGYSLKRINKWRTVLQKLQSKNGIDVSEKSDVRAACEQDRKDFC